MEERPNVTVVYQNAPSRPPGFLAILAELIAFFLMLALAGLLAGLMGKW